MKPKKCALLGLISIFYSSCTFGSIGNSNNEKLILIQNLLTLQRGIRSPTSVQLQFLGDEVDQKPNEWILRSGSTNYSLKLESDSNVSWDMGSIRINPNQIFPGFSMREMPFDTNAKTHTPYTIPLDLPQTDPYSQGYNFLTAGSESLVKENTINTNTGFVHSSDKTRSISDTPLGIVSLINLEWAEFNLNMKILSPVSKNIKINFRKGSIVIRPKCRVTLSQGKQNPIPISFNYGNLFRDRNDSLANNSILQVFVSQSGDLFVSQFQSTSMYETIVKNLNQEDLVWFIPGCFPGVEL